VDGTDQEDKAALHTAIGFAVRATICPTDRGLHIHSSQLDGRPTRQATRRRRVILLKHVDNMMKSLAERAGIDPEKVYPHHTFTGARPVATASETGHAARVTERQRLGVCMRAAKALPAATHPITDLVAGGTARTT
jgi:hypothetical protein